MHKTLIIICLCCCLPFRVVHAQEASLAGNWVINEELSEATDDKVEEALRASGIRTNKGMFSNDDEYYRGGPAEQELYDFISYEKTLQISLAEAVYTFSYGEFVRPVYMDGRGNRVSLSGLDEVEDFSFGNWRDEELIVEGRPRDGGFTDEHYRLSEDGSQLIVELYLQPLAFSTGIELLRVYDRVSENQD